MNQKDVPQDIQDEAMRLYPDNGIAVITTAFGRKSYIAGALAERERDKRNLRATLIQFLDSIREYEHESGHSVYQDDRESLEFVDIYLSENLPSPPQQK